MKRVCLVTEELAGAGKSGGIGAAFKELALLLAREGYLVDILYHNALRADPDILKDAKRYYASNSIRLDILDIDKYFAGGDSYKAASYAAFRALKEKQYDFIHFHDYKGIGFFSCEAKKQGLAFSETALVVQLHGPTRWTVEANETLFVHEDQVSIDFMERRSIELADVVVSPSEFLMKWAQDKFDGTASLKSGVVIKNLCRNLLKDISRASRDNPKKPLKKGSLKEIIVFGRHEERKGISIACDALDKLNKFLAEQKIKVTFVGQPGNIGGQPSSIYFVDRTLEWKFDFEFYFCFGRYNAAKYIAESENSLVIIPSVSENSPYTVLETLYIGKPVLCSSGGGGGELILVDDRNFATCTMTAEELSDALLRVWSEGLPVARPSETIEEVEARWIEFHEKKYFDSVSDKKDQETPLVTIGVTHYERPKKVIDAVISLIKQTYQRYEIIVVDDGSKNPQTLKALEYLENIVSRNGGRIIYQKNAYLGAARNAVLREAKGDFLIFLDDDDIALPHMVETLVQSIVSSGVDAVSCLNIFMPEADRSRFIAGEDVGEKINYFPLGGPLSLSPEQNVFGSATALFRISALRGVGGYTELSNVGHEDYELYLRLAQAGYRISVCPEPLFYYEVGRPSMISRTNMTRNFKRCFDAIDISDNGNVWEDYINLNVGRRCLVNSHNRSWWLNSLRATATIRHQLMESSIGLTEYVALSMRLAKEEGNLKAVKAFSNALYVPGLESDEEFTAIEEVAMSTPTKKTGEYIFSEDVEGIKLDIALGRHEDAVHKIVSVLNESPVVTEDIRLSIASITQENSAVSVEAYMGLASAFLRCRSSIPKADVSLLAMRIFFRAKEYKKCISVIRNLLRADSEDYVTSHPDVAGMVASGALSAYDHYKKFGVSESRIGFERTGALIKELSALGLKGWDVSEINEVIEILRREEAVSEQTL